MKQKENSINGKHNWYERLLNIIGMVKPGEGESCILFTLNACLLMTAYYLLKVIREPLILSYGGAEYKSYATAFQAITLLVVLPFFSSFYHKHAASKVRSVIVNKVFLFFISHLLIFSFLKFLNVNIGMAFYIWLGIFSVMVVAQFWAFAADTYNVKSGQRLFVIIAIGATLGAWIGSRLAGIVFPYLGINGIMLLSAGVLFLSVLITAKIEKTVPEFSMNEESTHKENTSNRWLDGFSTVFKNNYLLLIACFVTLLIFINSTGEYILARFVSEESQILLDSGKIANVVHWQSSFYSSYYSWITMGSFLLQAFLVSRIFKWVGIRGAVMVLPVIMIIGYSFMLYFPIFAFVRYAMTFENSANYSVQNTTRHALFLPVPRKLKYLGKTTIETFFYRFGDLLYGVFVYLMTTHANFMIHHYIMINLFLSVVLFFVAWKVGHKNLKEMRKSKPDSVLSLKAVIPHLHMPSGQMSKFSVSECTFVDPSVGDALHYHAERESGDPLPGWIEFDPMTRTFTFDSPNDFIGRFNLRIIATDFDGNKASCGIKLTFYKEEPEVLPA
ncbi:ATP translocase [Aliikangiella sp. G2MR2-5]|uniref:ATP translocase n=1 Tax=Aliikangiella sp. G2MR2-5 TaxID=2788943 RepID=UPI0018A9C477|nr:ATP translocase [Aliikangiella sp. G2MR2-5]